MMERLNLRTIRMNKVNKKQRNSSLELLRIIAMLMIIAHHYVYHGNFTFTVNNDIFATIYLKCISMFGKTACSIFALITGYFMIDADTSNKLYRRIVPLLFKMVFYSLFVIGISSIIFNYFSIVDIIKAFLPLFYNANWYVQTYVCFFFFIPFINKFIMAMDKRQYRRLLLLITVIYFLINTFVFNRFSFDYLYFMFNMYMFGAYYKLFGKSSKNNNYNLLYSLAFFAIMIASSIMMVIIAYKTNNNTLLYEDNPLASYSNIVSFGFAYFLFKYHANKEYVNKYINIISSTTLSIYLLHDNANIYEIIWWRWSPNYLYINNPYIHSIIKITIVFLCCMLIDLIRQYTIHILFEKNIYPHINNKLDKISDIIINRIDKYQI